MKHKKIVNIVLAASLFTTVLPAKAIEANTGSQLVSVKLQNYLGNKTSINLDINGSYYLSGHPDKEFSSGYSVTKGTDGTLVLTSKDGSYSVVLKSGFTLVPKAYGTSHTISINGITYLGNMQFTLEGNYIRPVNTLSTEDYLKGVVPYEMSNSWELEAQKAQAVAARTYALSKGTVAINDTTQYQVYKGYDATNSRSIQAVNETKGKVLTSGDRYISALYSATNGGWQMSNTNIWGSSLEPYLTSKPDAHSVDAGQHLNWWFSLEKEQIDTSVLDLTKPDGWWLTVNEKVMDKKQITEIKNATRTSVGAASVNDFKITEIVNVKYDAPGDATKRLKAAVTFNYFLKKDGKYVMNEEGNIQTNTYTLERDSDDMRAVFSSQISPYIKKVEETETTFKVIGSGYGHGVGMSQWGAKQMAKTNHNYEQILAFYYDGAVLKTENTAYAGVIPSIDSVIVDENESQTEVPQGVTTYTVQAGDNRSSIASKFGITVDQLTQWNNIQPPYYVYKGTVMIVSDPGKGENKPDPTPTPTPETPKDTTAPAEVSGLKATAGVDTVTLSFTKPKDADFSHIEILRNGKVVSEKVTGGTYADKGLKEGTKYSYTVKTVDQAGNKSKGSEVTATTTKTPEKKPVDNAVYHTVKSGETLWKISQTYKVSTSELQKLNGLKNATIHVGQKLKVKDGGKVEVPTPTPTPTPKPEENTTTYTVKKGDSLSAIAKKYNTTYQQIMNLNGMKNTTIFVGQKLKVSGSSSSTPVTNTPSKPTTPTTTTKKTGKVTASTLNMRSGAGTSHKVVATLKRNQTVTVNSVSGKWAYVTYGSKKGYVHTDYLTISTTTASAKPSATTSKTHVVKSGDTLYGVAKIYNVNVASLKTWNKLASNTIRIGQQLVVKA